MSLPYPGTPAFENYKDKIIANKYEDFNQWQLVFKHENFDKNKIRVIRFILQILLF